MEASTSSIVPESESGTPVGTPVILEYNPFQAHPIDCDPPSYEEARKPTTKVTYSFSQLTFNSMILLPPPNSQNTRPLYRILISMNCFMPSSFITTINRGGSEHGEFVGDFEMGIVNKTSTVLIRDTEHKLFEIIKLNRRQNTVWTWFPNDPKYKLFWLPQTSVSKCFKEFTLGTKTPIASFHHTPILRRRGGHVTLPQLVVEPVGHEYFDDILMSLLVFERKRLVPHSEDTIFN